MHGSAAGDRPFDLCMRVLEQTTAKLPQRLFDSRQKGLTLSRDFHLRFHHSPSPKIIDHTRIDGRVAMVNHKKRKVNLNEKSKSAGKVQRSEKN